MDVVHRLLGHVEVDYVAHVGNVDTAGENIGRHQHVALAGAKRLERPLALGLAAVAVDGGAGNAGARQTAAARVGAALGAGEDDNALGALRKQQVCQDPVLRLKRDGQQVLLDGLGGGGGRGDLDARRIAHQIGNGAHGGLVQGRGEQQGLSIGGRIAYDLADGGQKAHVEHAVGLVQNQDLDLVQHAGALVDEVDQAARRGDQDVAPALEGALLGVV